MLHTLPQRLPRVQYLWNQKPSLASVPPRTWDELLRARMKGTTVLQPGTERVLFEVPSRFGEAF